MYIYLITVIGLLLPFYELDYDLGSFGFVSSNGIKIVVLKIIENSFQEVSSEIKMKQVS